MNVSDTAKVQRYLRQRFGNHKLTLARRENKDDSAELMLENEFIGVDRCFAMTRMVTPVTMCKSPFWPKIWTIRLTY